MPRPVAQQLTVAARKNVLAIYQMDIDQRLEKLTERHEALSQSVELLVIAWRGSPMRTRNGSPV